MSPLVGLTYRVDSTGSRIPLLVQEGAGGGRTSTARDRQFPSVS